MCFREYVDIYNIYWSYFDYSDDDGPSASAR